VRFYGDYAGGHDLHALAAHNHVYFGRREDGVLESEFSGNLVEVCPTGVFIDKTLSRRYTRKWDLRSTPSVCVHCGIGCNIFAQERYGELRRILNRYHQELNGYFICDRGRFGYEFVNGPGRLRGPLLREQRESLPSPVSSGTAVETAARWLQTEPRPVGIGSPRASLEANYALRALVGEDRFYLGMTETPLLLRILAIMRGGPAQIPTLREVEAADAVLVLGEDVPNTAPRLALALRQAVRQAGYAIADRQHIPRWQDSSVRDAVKEIKSPVLIATPAGTRIDDIAMATYRAGPESIAHFAYAIAHALDPNVPEPTAIRDSTRHLAGQMADALRTAQRPLIVAGTSLGSPAIIEAAAAVTQALHRAARSSHLLYCVPECNSLGLALLGGAGGLEAALQTLAQGQGQAGTAIVLENDLYRRADPRLVDRALSRVQRIIVIDHTRHRTTERAHLVLPAATFADSEGTLVNNEGRAQRYYPVIATGSATSEHRDEVRPSALWLRELLIACGHDHARNWHNIDEILHDLTATVPALAPLAQGDPGPGFRIAGLKIARETHRYSGRTAMHAQINVHEPKPPDDTGSPLTFTMEGYQGPRTPAPLVPFFWAPGWDSEQAALRYQQHVNGPLRHGPVGVRLILQVTASGDRGRHAALPASRQPERKELPLVPRYEVFGSEELSTLAPAVAERMPVPALTLHPTDAALLGLKQGARVRITVDRQVVSLPLRLDATLAPGVGGYPAGAINVDVLGTTGMTLIAQLAPDPALSEPLGKELG
jgi:NADH-quinone oxidoreductase subunit G